MLQLISLLTGVHWRDQGPAFLVGFGHGGTHWVAAFFYLLLPYITRDLGLSYAQAGLLVSIFHLSSLLTNFGSGLMVDITGRRVSLQIVSLLIGAGALFAFGVSEQFLVLAFLVMLIGASNNLWHPPAIAYLSEIYPDNRGYALVVVLASMGRWGEWFARRLPHRAGSVYLRFQHGTLSSFKPSLLPPLLALSVAGWLLALGRWYFVIAALDISLSLPMLILITLLNAVLAAIPLTPGGLGVIEPGIAGLLMLQLAAENAISVTLLERAISYVSILVVGGLLFLGGEIRARRTDAAAE